MQAERRFMIKPLRILVSFGLVVAAYCLYSLAVVPFIEPEETLADQEKVTDDERQQALASVTNQRTDLLRWFKAGDWELTSPKILETSQGKLLLKEYQPNPKDAHEVTLTPCTMIFLPEGQFDDEEERLRRAIVLRSPEGARLRFAEPIDLKRGQMGSKIVGGELLGKVTIRSDQRSPGPEDDLLMITERVTLADDRITTPHLVEFFYGPNHGRGREMRLDLTTAAEKAAQPMLPAAKSFELAREVHMRMESAEGDVFLGGQPIAAKAEKSPRSAKPPVEITCQRAFKFDMRKYIATFHDRVDVVRLNPVGPSDQLTCERLSLHFETDPTAAHPTATGAAPGAAAAGGKAMPKLRPKRIIADGNPVKLHSRSNGVEARGRRLEYDVQSRSGKLLDGKEAMLRQNDPVTGQVREIHARELEFESDPTMPSGPPRRVDARGKGWLSGSPPSNPGKQLFVSWTSRLTFQPYKGSQVLSIRGGARVKTPESGALEADEIHLWLQRAAAGTAAPTFGAGSSGEGGFVPEKMTARGHVKPDAPQLTGVVRQMDVWFEKPAPVAPVAATGAAPAPAPEPEPPPKSEERAPSNQRWNVSGDLLNVQARFVSGKADVTEVTLDGHARCAELPSVMRVGPLPPTPEQLLEITGEQFHLLQPTPESATVRVTGRPARTEARGMTLIGGSDKKTGSIHLHRASNRLWIPGEGSLSLPVEEDMQGRKLAQKQRLNIDWQGRMDFDGTTAHFQSVNGEAAEPAPRSSTRPKDVIAYTDEATLKTPDLQVVFTEPVRFQADGEGRRPQIERLFCRKGVDLDHRQRQNGLWLSWERMTARDLTYHYSSGDLEANGPGSITRSWLDDGNSSPVMPGGPSKKPPPTTPQKGHRLLYLHATFDDKLTGNQQRETVTLHRRVSAVYGPILRWQASIDPNYRERLGTEGFVLDCDLLTVEKDTTSHDKQAAMELTGEGNTLIYGSDFNARCRSVRYASGKDMLTLSGDGRSPATFYRQQQSGSRPIQFSAGRIFYELKSQHLDVNNFDLLDVIDLQIKKPPAKPPVPVPVPVPMRMPRVPVPVNGRR
jgi:hypothetical protein